MNSTSFASLSLDGTANINFSTMFKVRVGRDGALKEWDLPAALASRRSVFFKNALKDHGQNDCWKEGDERLVTLAEDDPEIFSLYLYVFYNEPLPLKSLNRVKLADLDKEDEELHSDQNKDQVQVDQTTLCHLYVFAEFLQDVRAKNKILCVSSWARCCRATPGTITGHFYLVQKQSILSGKVPKMSPRLEPC
jgi:hypothetical protein